MKEKIVISCIVVGLQILCIASQAYAIPTSTPSSTTTTPETSINATKKPVNRTVLLAASSLPKSNDLKKLDPGQNGTNVTAKFSNDGEHPIQQIGDGVQLAKEKENATIQVVKESGIEDTNLKLVSSKPAPLSDEDKKVRRAWGGNCTAAVWDVCNKVKFWGGNYVIPDKKNPGKFIVKNYKIHCVEKPDKTFCLRNGWTVARCHMLCMSQNIGKVTTNWWLMKENAGCQFLGRGDSSTIEPDMEKGLHLSIFKMQVDCRMNDGWRMLNATLN